MENALEDIADILRKNGYQVTKIEPKFTKESSIEKFCTLLEDKFDSNKSTRAYNSLKSSGINTVSDLLKQGREIRRYRNLGSKTFNAINELIEESGFYLK